MARALPALAAIALKRAIGRTSVRNRRVYVCLNNHHQAGLINYRPFSLLSKCMNSHYWMALVKHLQTDKMAIVLLWYVCFFMLQHTVSQWLSRLSAVKKGSLIIISQIEDIIENGMKKVPGYRTAWSISNNQDSFSVYIGVDFVNTCVCCNCIACRGKSRCSNISMQFVFFLLVVHFLAET